MRRGIDGLAVPSDVSDPDDVARMARRVRRRLGPIDVLVNNAGVIQVGPIDALSLEDFRKAMAVNFWGAVHCTLAVLPKMQERGTGRIVNVTSVGGKVAMPHLLPYDCAKFAFVGFSEGLRAELVRHGIPVTTVVPGLMRTGGPANAFFKGDPPLEYTWFSLADGTSLTAMDVARAARRIVRAARRGEAEVTLSWQAKAVRITHALLPGATSTVLGVVNQILSRGSDVKAAIRGKELDSAFAPSATTAQTDGAATNLNQYGGRPRPSPAHAERVGVGGPKGERR